MEMVAVRGIGRRPENCSERPTGRTVHLAQLVPVVTAVPIVQHRDPLAVLEPEPRDIDRTAETVFGQPRACLIVARATGVMTRNQNLRHTAAFASDCGFEPRLYPCLERFGGRTIDCRTLAEGDPRNRAEPNRTFDPATAAPIDRSDGFTLDVGVPADLPAKPRLHC